jgi:putative nucleotidyltransferase with HDIG domain
MSKGNLTRLGPVVARELAETAERRRRQDAERALRARDAILRAVGNAADRLVRMASWEEAVQPVLAEVGRVTGAARLLVYQNRARGGGRKGVLHLGWQTDHIAPSADHDGLRSLSWSRMLPIWDLAVAGPGVAFAVGDRRLSDYVLRWMARSEARALCVVPIRMGTVWWGAIVVLDSEARAWSDAEVSALRVLADTLGASMERTDLLQALTRSHAELAEAYNRTLEGWALALELRDQETAGHTRRVAEMTVRLARSMGIDGEPLTHIRRGALLHDIGKMGVPDAILLKPGPLNEEERKIMQLHPVYAYDLLQSIPYLRPALDIPYAHHERWDGMGYPRGLEGEEIPIAARIFAIVDVWDAMRSDRPYREAISEEDTLTEIEAGAGTHFDPAIVEAFLRLARARDPAAEADATATALSRDVGPFSEVTPSEPAREVLTD